MRKTTAVVITFLVGAVGVGSSSYRGGQGTVEPAMGDVVREIEALGAMRSGLAESFTGEPDQETFARVCMPVGAEAKRLATENGWKIAQLAERHRNPEHKLDYEALRVFKMMEDDAGLMGMWIKAEMDGRRGHRYFRRIVVEPACLACHGPRAGRPQFVKDGYPDDRAYGFEVGDLRGLFSVFIAD
jgi:hypothetical protein